MKYKHFKQALLFKVGSIIEFTDHEKEDFLKEWPKKGKTFIAVLFFGLRIMDR